MLVAWQYGQQVWDALLADIGNEYGVAGIMGNLDAESNITPYAVENDSAPWTFSQQYTAMVDAGTVSEYSFVNQAPASGYNKGYGLAQWTIPQRKQGLYNYCKRQTPVVSIADVDRQVAYLLHELKSTDIDPRFPQVYDACVNAQSIADASDIFLDIFENPAVKPYEYRRRLGQAVYDEYHGEPPPPPPPPHHRRKLPIYFYLRVQRRF